MSIVGLPPTCPYRPCQHPSHDPSGKTELHRATKYLFYIELCTFLSKSNGLEFHFVVDDNQDAVPLLSTSSSIEHFSDTLVLVHSAMGVAYVELKSILSMFYCIQNPVFVWSNFVTYVIQHLERFQTTIAP